ncbi:MAG: 50S ribosomal protein L17 [Bacteroidia bacterium]|nr:50S ribosomal protein L17 [Bacteroidia bacterium]
MRHRLKDNHLGRTKSHRDALMSSLASSLILHKRINTTLAKAKALRRYVEPLLTKSKTDTMHSRRVVFSHLQDKTAVSALFRDIAEKISERNGGYTRIIKLGSRPGDRAEMAMIELVDFNVLLGGKGASAAAGETKKKGTRRGKKKTEGGSAKAEEGK